MTPKHTSERTSAPSEDVFALGDPCLDAIMRELMLRVGKVIARNLDAPPGEVRVQ